MKQSSLSINYFGIISLVLIFVLSSNSLLAQKQDKTIRKLNNAICDCMESDKIDSDTLTLDEAVTECVTIEITSLIEKKKNFISKYNLDNLETLKEFIGDRQLDAYTQCEFVIKTKKIIRDNYDSYVYDGTDNDKAERYYKKGNNLMDDGDYEDAIDYFRMAVREDTSFVEAFDHLGICSRLIEQYDNAERYYLRAIELAPYGTFALQNLGVVYSSQQEWGKALEHYELVITTDMSNPEGYYGAATILYQIDELETAMVFIDYAINIYEVLEHRDLADGYYVKGLILIDQNNIKEAKKWIKKADKLGRDIPSSVWRDLR